MNAPFQPLPRPLPETLDAIRRLRERSAAELINSMAARREDLRDYVPRGGWTADDYERSASADHMAAERLADEAREELDMDTRLTLWSVSGLYADRARVCLAQARDLRADAE